jgi:endonuclease/exonuclease/phosphatase family metal-dependent hydrolase
MHFLKSLFSILFLFFALGLASQTARLMTINIRYDNPGDKENNWHERKAEMVQMLKHYEPQIFGIQEGLVHQAAYLDSTLTDYQYIGVGRDDGKTKGEFSAIYFDSTVYEVMEHSTFWLSETPDEISVGWDASMERICTYGLFHHKASGHKFWVFNAHFDHIGEAARSNSASLIIAKVRQLNKQNLPVVVMGDFNAYPGSRAITAFKTTLDDGQDISIKPFYGPIGTFNRFSNQVLPGRIDYIFTSKLKVLSYVHIDDRRANNLFISDHLPVMVEAAFSNTD